MLNIKEWGQRLLHAIGQTREYRKEYREVIEIGVARRVNRHGIEFSVGGTNYAAPTSLAHRQFKEGEAVEVKFKAQILQTYDFKNGNYKTREKIIEFEEERRVVDAYSLETRADAA